MTNPASVPAGAHLIIGPLASALTAGLTQQMLAVVTDVNGEPVSIDVGWSSSDTRIATVDAAGLVTALMVGTATVTATVGPLGAAAHLVVQSDAVTSPSLLEHRDVTATIFWVGEGADATNWFISNAESAFDANWLVHYGGVDAPSPRRGYLPAGFTPLENPFYFALPYSDLDDDGRRKQNAATVVPWAATQVPASGSLVKNRWMRITSSATARTCYAQWQDAGPGLYDDFQYVFGSAAPSNPFLLEGMTRASALDVSPAVRDCLGLSVGVMRLTWQFVADADVPAGPWMDVVTRR